MKRVSKKGNTKLVLNVGARTVILNVEIPLHIHTDVLLCLK